MFKKIIGVPIFSYQDKFDIKTLWKDNLDKKEYDRQLSEHYGILTYLNDNFITPIKKQMDEGINVLDVGCGCGIWTLDNARNFERSIFIGIDIVNYFPDNTIPKNVNFYRYNFLDEDFHEIIKYNSFEFIYSRHMITSYTINDWDVAIGKIYKILKIGGYVEFVEFDIKNSTVGPLTKKINDCILKILKNNKNDIDISINLENNLINNGFNEKNIVIKYKNISLNDCYFKEDFILGYMRLKKGIMNILNISENKFDDILEKIKKEWDTNQSYIRLLIVSAKK